MLQIPRSKLATTDDVLGRGTYGVIKKGVWTTNKRTVDVAIKVVKNMTREDLEEEAQVMAKLNHPNIVQFLGFCRDYSPGAIVMELMFNGSLLSYVRREKRYFKANVDSLTQHCLEIALGMEYLEKKKYVHRDIAARNCLVTAQHVAKVSDFGLMRRTYEGHHLTYASPVPFRWAAPEVLRNQELSHKSDVWAFGVLMWEVFTLGRLPYGPQASVTNEDVEQMLEKGLILDQPWLCPDNVYAIMIKCFEYYPKRRPRFTKLGDLLEDVLGYE